LVCILPGRGGRCDQYCSNNIVTTVTDLVQAIWDDIETIVTLIGRCFGGHGIAGCICQFAVRARPAPLLRTNRERDT